MSELEGFEDFDDSNEVIIAKDEHGNDVEFIILDTIEHNKIIYLLVIEGEFIEDDEAEAVILKESKDSEDDKYSNYSFIEDEAELDEIIKLFQDNSDDYAIEL